MGQQETIDVSHGIITLDLLAGTWPRNNRSELSPLLLICVYYVICTFTGYLMAVVFSKHFVTKKLVIL